MSFPIDIYVLALVAAAATSACSLPFWRKWCLRTGTMDDPGHRKIHTAPVPLAGGLAVMTGLVAPLVIGAAILVARRGISSALFGASPAQLLHYGMGRRAVQLAGITAGAFGMLLLGLRDDKADLSPAAKFAGQLLIALLVSATGVRITLFVHSLLFSYAITVLWILTLVNAFNFMDNMNGLCAGLGLIGAIYFALISAAGGQYLVAAVAFLTAGALAGFLPWNYPKATAFLGDAGSHLTGYLLAVLGILPHFYTPRHPKIFAVLAPLFVLGIPLIDLAWVVCLRLKMGKPFYIGDTNHLSHRLVRRGWTKARAVAFIWLLAAALGGCAFLLQ